MVMHQPDIINEMAHHMDGQSLLVFMPIYFCALWGWRKPFIETVFSGPSTKIHHINNTSGTSIDGRMIQ